jgi:hypothetical protein
MKKVFIIYSADTWISSASKELIAICDSKNAAVNLLIPEIKKASKESFEDQGYENASQLFNDALYLLQDKNQTQQFSTNYVIEEKELNTIF